MNFRPQILSIVLVVLLSGQVFADAPPTYYNSVDLTSQATLRTSLHNIIDGHTRYPYSSSSTDTWDILESADQSATNSNQVLDVYQNRTFNKFGGGNGPYNREHSWPNSYGFPSSGSTAYTDCHHLFICDLEYNGARGSYIFGDCMSSCTAFNTDVNEGAGGSGQANYRGNNNGQTVWETWIGRRGDIARALMYMDVRYEGDSGEPDLVLTDNPALIQYTSSSPAYMGLLSTLIQWHNEDPVDDRERRRNDVVYSYQGNRNPFIDHPEWVSYLFLGIISPVEEELPLPSANAVIASIYPNPFNPTTNIELVMPQAGPVRVEVYNLEGKLVRTLINETRPAGEFNLTWSGLDDRGRRVSSGSYFCRMQSGDVSDTRKLLLLK